MDDPFQGLLSSSAQYRNFRGHALCLFAIDFMKAFKWN